MDDGSIDECINNIGTFTSEDSLVNDFMLNRAIWNCHEVNHYLLDVEIQTELCSGVLFQVEIANNDITNSTTSDNANDYLIPFCAIYDIDSLFALIGAALDPNIPLPDELQDPRDMRPDMAHNVIIEYHKDLGYPSRGYIDYIFGIADEEFGFSVLSVKQLE